MSAGGFEKRKYELDNGTIIGIKVQPETLSLTIGANTNTEPAGDAVAGLGSARVSGGERQIGIRARGVVFKFDGTPPPGYKQGGYIRLPILRKAMWDAITDTSAGGYELNGITYTVSVVGKYAQETK